MVFVNIDYYNLMKNNRKDLKFTSFSFDYQKNCIHIEKNSKMSNFYDYFSLNYNENNIFGFVLMFENCIKVSLIVFFTVVYKYYKFKGKIYFEFKFVKSTNNLLCNYKINNIFI